MREVKTGRRFRGLRLFWFATFLLSLSVLVFGQKGPDPWLILTSGGKAPLNSHTAHEDLVRIFGAGNVVEQDGIDGMSGDMEYATVLFPKDPQRKVEIVWRDAEKKTMPSSMTISGDSSKWKTEHGISLGTRLSELERLNGRPFRLTGFNWDYSGTVTSWEEGLLEEDLQSSGRVILRLGDAANTGLTEEESREVEGDGEFSSRHPVMQKLNPSVYEIVWVFP
jgi:hypothetical protein